MTEQVDIAVAAWSRVLMLCADALPGGFHRRGDRGAAEVVTGLPVPTINGVFQVGPAVDADEVAAFAADHRLTEVPWSLQLRNDEAAGRVAAIAAEHKLDQPIRLPFMLKELTASDAEPAAGKQTVRRISGADRDRYRRALAIGYEAPEVVFDGFSSPPLLDHPAMAAYVVEVAGEVVATSFGVRVDDLVGVFNIAVPPAHRRRGYGRLATEVVLRDARRDGARTAFLHAAPLGVPLYEAMGFHIAETWTVLTPH
jgi:ribosomal protein S18 acetylase RimI-like enzyme